MELVEQDRRLRYSRLRNGAERPPHVHHGEPDFAALLAPQPVIERRHAGLGAIRAAEPDRPLANEVADHDAVAVAFADRDLVDADRMRGGRAGTSELGPHVLLLQRLDRVPVKLEVAGDIADRCLLAAAADIVRKALGEMRVVRQKIQALAFHAATTTAVDAPHLQFQDNPKPRTRQVANLPQAPVVPALLRQPTAPANRFFERRSRRTITTSGAPNTPRTAACARKPANEYPSDRRRCRFDESAIHSGCQTPTPCEMPESQYPQRFLPCPPHQITHTTSRRPKKMIDVLGEEYVRSLRKAYSNSLSGGVDHVMYWFDKAWRLIELGNVRRAGLVGTNSIRGGANRETLRGIVERGHIFDAWSDEPWIVEGAAVRVSLVCFDRSEDGSARLNGRAVDSIHPDLTAGEMTNLTEVQRLPQNAQKSFMGVTKSGPFDLPGETARRFLSAPLNPNGRPNSDVIKRSINGGEITGRPTDRWIIDFGPRSMEDECSLFELPFQYASEVIKPARLRSRTPNNRESWWRYERHRPDMYDAIGSQRIYIATAMVAKHRMFVFSPSAVIPENLVIVIARDDDVTFGVLHSRFHELWSLRMGTSLEDRPRYTPTTCFETFPFPEGLTPDIPAANYAGDPRAIAIADAAKRLNELREAWLNPSDLVKRVPEVVPGFPDRILPVDDNAAAILKKRTLTNLYNERPAWLANAHSDLDAAVAAAYGWPADISEDDALARLFALNQSRAIVAGKAA